MGGIFLGLGLLTRFVSIPLAITMVVAFIMVHGSKGFALPDGFEYVMVLFAAQLVFLTVGPGRYSLDALLLGGRRVVPEEAREH